MTTIPKSVEAEDAVLGSILIDPDAITKVVHFLKPEHFFVGVNKKIYDAVLSVFKDGGDIDIVSVLAEMEGRGQKDTDNYLIGLMGKVPTPVHVEKYARIVKAAAVRRKVIVAGGEIAGLGYDNEKDSGQIISDSIKKLTDIDIGDDGDVKDLSKISNEYMSEIDHWLKEGRGTWGIPTGLIDLDKQLGGFQNKHLVIIAGRPGMGKTALALQIAAHASRKGFPALFISLESGNIALINRLACNYALVDSWELRNGTVTTDGLQRISKAVAQISEIPMYIHDGGGLTSQQIRTIVMREQLRHGIRLVVVDHIQLMANKGQSLNERWGQVTRDFKAMASQLDCCVVALSQLSRAVEGRNNRRPMLHDLRESGSIEQDADLVLGLYREDYYKEEYAAPTNIAEIAVLKARDGRPNWTARTMFRPKFTRFDNLARKEG